ncbi:GNAT family N-acetyltransferase [Pseudothauera nasutitermitis]|uniref:GNAT family N-acetyltransferase n=1 Tax=Pseudothauera nasutitermitis TaxID=2565930 RepID=A0A4S4AW25_9RHOO|nr:GNAT family N-acetyltransferase [Pseudothauera nasutitermitis]THF62788.1 GNAT family N-acetyltransferase [Pseudothauera nasutitermitis]
MEIIRVAETWQLAAVHYLRIQVALSLDIPVAGEIDEKPGEKVDYLLIMDGPTPAATGRLRNYEGKAKFERITVAVDRQGQGIGRLLMQGLETWAYETGLREALVTGKLEVLDFYLKLGYATDGAVTQGGRFPLVRLTKALGPRGG